MFSISRVVRTKSEAKDAYNRMSRWYDLLAGSSERKFTELALQMLCVKPGERVLEIGCGTGHSMLALAQAAGDTGKVFGLDLSAGMIKITRNRIAAAGLTNRTLLVSGDGANLPLETANFEAVFMGFVLELFDTPEIPLVLTECQRILRPGGRIAIASLSKRVDNLAVRIYEWAHWTMPKYIDCRPIFVQNMLEEMGFEILQAEQESMFGLPVEIMLARVRRVYENDPAAKC